MRVRPEVEAMLPRQINRARYWVAAMVACVAGFARAAGGDGSFEIDFVIAHRDGLRNVVAVRADLSVARAAVHEVSDLQLEISAPGSNADLALGAQDGVRHAGGARLFRARLYVVINGRLSSDALASCAPWYSDESRCTVDCDGGGFTLRRSGARAGRGLELTLESAEGGDADVLAPGVSITACQGGEGGEMRLLPADGAARVQLPFVQR